MSIIKGSRNFKGSNLDENNFSYFKPEVRQLIFSKKKNPDGLHLIFLPAYKEDTNGEGVWYKKVSVRDNFGIELKRKYMVKDPSSDPATYFEKSFKAQYPEQAEPTLDDKGFKQYPPYGRMTNRVVFNVALLRELIDGQPVEKVIHVLDLPSFNGADKLTKWMNEPDPDGNLNPLLNDPEAAISVFVKLGSGVNPWQLSPNPAHKYEIPEEYGDASVLYNLDEIFIEKSNEEIISDLRGMFSGPIFDSCMDGFAGLTRRVVPGNSFTSTETNSTLVSPIVTKSSGVIKLPSPASSVTPALSKLPPVPPVVENDDVNEVTEEAPVAPPTKLKNADLKNFLKSKRQ